MDNKSGIMTESPQSQALGQTKTGNIGQSMQAQGEVMQEEYRPSLADVIDSGMEGKVQPRFATLG